jgi:hypothetical protein
MPCKNSMVEPNSLLTNGSEKLVVVALAVFCQVAV